MPMRCDEARGALERRSAEARKRKMRESVRVARVARSEEAVCCRRERV